MKIKWQLDSFLSVLFPLIQGCGPCQLLLKHSAYRRMLIFLLGPNRQNNQVQLHHVIVQEALIHSTEILSPPTLLHSEFSNPQDFFLF